MDLDIGKKDLTQIPEKQLDTFSRLEFSRKVMAYMKDLDEVRQDLFASLPKNVIKTDAKDALSQCIRDYHAVPGYLSSIADYENRAIILNILTDDKKKQLVLVPGKGLGCIKLINEEIPPNAKISFFEQDQILEDFGTNAQTVSDEIDRALYALNIKVEDRHIEQYPDKHPSRTLGGNRFYPLTGPTSQT